MEDSGPSIYPPSIHVNDKEISEIKDFNAGDHFRMEIEVHVASKDDRDRDNRPKRVSAQLDIVAYKVLTKKPAVKDMTDAELEKLQGGALAS